MSDYFSQWLLKPIHNTLLKQLRRLSLTDRTFTQEPSHCWENNGSKFHSLDLSAATDRFPIDLQYKVIKYLFGSHVLADSWKYILQGRDYINPEGKPLRYAVGQPMGCYSS